MEESNLVASFENSLEADIVEFAGDAIEFGADLCMDDGILKDIPFVGTAFKLYSIGSKVYDRHSFGKLYAFIVAINNGGYSKEDKEKRRKKFVENEAFRKQELEYLLVLIDRYIGFEKPQMLAQIYLAYIDGEIDWSELTKYAEVVDRFLPGDKEFFLKERALYRKVSVPVPDAFLRLAALGIYEEYMTDFIAPTTLGSITIPAKQEKTFKTTAFGEKLQDILEHINTGIHTAKMLD